jgi:hypothetical protein
VNAANKLGYGALCNGYDADTGIPIYRSGNINILLFNQTENDQMVVRVGNDGGVYVGCNHLTLGRGASPSRIGSLQSAPLNSIISDFDRGIAPLKLALQSVPLSCSKCSYWNSCRGGDGLSGVYFDGVARDPYCSILADHNEDLPAPGQEPN